MLRLHNYTPRPLLFLADPPPYNATQHALPTSDRISPRLQRTPFGNGKEATSSSRPRIPRNAALSETARRLQAYSSGRRQRGVGILRTLLTACPPVSARTGRVRGSGKIGTGPDRPHPDQEMEEVTRIFLDRSPSCFPFLFLFLAYRGLVYAEKGPENPNGGIVYCTAAPSTVGRVFLIFERTIIKSTRLHGGGVSVYQPLSASISVSLALDFLDDIVPKIQAD